MRLQMGSFPVDNIAFGIRTCLAGTTLEVNRQELRQLLLQQTEFADVEIEAVHPRDPVRLVHVMDVAEPRWKPEGRSNFPGLVGPQETVGAGVTHRLSGMAVVSIGEAVAGEPTYWREGIIDMFGPGADYTPFGKTANLVLNFHPKAEFLVEDAPEAKGTNGTSGGVFSERFNHAVRVAELKAATYLAQASQGMKPKEWEVLELTPVPDSLPRVLYIYQLSGCYIYGELIRSTLPAFIHPNEVLDGAMVNARSNNHAHSRDSTYLDLNHAVIQELYARHGRDINFLGMIVYPPGSGDMPQKERITNYVAKLVQVMKADGACITFNGGGNAGIDFMLTCQKCERVGVKTVLMTPETYGTPEDHGFVHFLPEAVAIVSTGRSTQKISLPRAERVIGGASFFDLPDPVEGPFDIELRYLYTCGNNKGYWNLTARTF